MSNRVTPKDELFRVAVAWLSEPSNREHIKCSRWRVLKALDYLGWLISTAKAELEPGLAAEQRAWRAPKAYKVSPFDDERKQRVKENRARNLEARRQRDSDIEAERLRRAALTPQQRADEDAFEDFKIDTHNACYRAMNAAYDAVMIMGKSVGNLWYHELEAHRRESAFAASLLTQLIHHGTPSGPVRVRDMVSPEVLTRMIATATRDAGR